MVKIRILYFGKVKALLGISCEDIDLNDTTVIKDQDILGMILAKQSMDYTEENRKLLEEVLNKSLLAVDDEYIPRGSSFAVSESMLISVIPPISGG